MLYRLASPAQEQTHHSDASDEVEVLLDSVQRRTFAYFWEGAHPVSGFAYDRRLTYGEPNNDLVAIGASGFSFIAMVIGVHRGWIARHEALERLAMMLSMLEKATLYHGAFSHFINGATGETVAFSRFDDGGDLVETALLLQGMICAREFFCGSDPVETDIRQRIDIIVNQVEWDWYTKGGKATLFWHWSPKHGWRKNLPVTGWNEALMTYVLALGAGRHAIDASLYHSGWARFGHFRNGTSYYGLELLLGKPFGGPLFLSQLSFCVLDPRLWQDGYADYWQQANAHAAINYRHCVKNPHGYYGYGPDCWGLTACHGPNGYLNCCPVNDVGIIAPSAALSSFPFLPREAEAALRFFLRYKNGRLLGRYGFVDAFAPDTGWIARTSLALNQGSTLAMIENYRTGLLWKLFAKVPELQKARRLIGN